MNNIIQYIKDRPGLQILIFIGIVIVCSQLGWMTDEIGCYRNMCG